MPIKEKPKEAQTVSFAQAPKAKPGENQTATTVADVPDKRRRPRAYDLNPHRYQWRFQSMPVQIRRDNKLITNPFREAALSVVHGVGEQEQGETAATLRVGIEDTVPRIQPKHSPGSIDGWIVPEPYIYGGYWANYGDMATMAAAAWKEFTDEEREYFSRVWSKRAISATRSVTWLVGNSLQLIKKGRWIARLYYIYLMPMLWIIAGAMLLHRKSRKLLSNYVNDARLYLEPKGDIEQEIVQRIDRKVGERFLVLLGYDWEFNKLTEKKQFKIATSPHRFRKVTWVAHSLGSVISYNVISDILQQCLQMRKAGGDKEKASIYIENSLQSFVTLGSPLDKIAFLFGDRVLRKWPMEYLPGGKFDLWKGQDGQARAFWQNFHYTSDPVSGRLDSFHAGNPDRNLVQNLHPAGRRFWGLSHTAYWKDKHILARILHLTFGSPYVKRLPLKLRSALRQRLALAIGAFFWAVAVSVVVGLMVYQLVTILKPI